MDAMQDFYQGSLLFHGAYSFMQLCRKLDAAYLFYFYFSSLLFFGT